MLTGAKSLGPVELFTGCTRSDSVQIAQDVVITYYWCVMLIQLHFVRVREYEIPNFGFHFHDLKCS